MLGNPLRVRQGFGRELYFQGRITSRSPSMIGKRMAPWVGLFALVVASPLSGQSSSPPNSQPPAPGLRKLTGDDEKRARQLDEQVDKEMRADRWPEAIKAAEELCALQTRARGT